MAHTLKMTFMSILVHNHCNYIHSHNAYDIILNDYCCNVAESGDDFHESTAENSVCSVIGGSIDCKYVHDIDADNVSCWFKIVFKSFHVPSPENYFRHQNIK
jgi:hypothetical protein